MDLVSILLVVFLILWAILAFATPRGTPTWGPTAALAAWLTTATVRLIGAA